MKRALFISSRPIYPAVYGGRIRAAQQLEFLTQRYQVDVVYQCEKKIEDATKSYLPQVNAVKCFTVPKWSCMLQALRFLYNRLPLQVNYYYNKEMYNYIRQHIGNYDIVFCNNIRTAEYVRSIEGPQKAIDFVDAISMNYEKAKDVAHGLKRLMYSIDFMRCVNYEQEILKEFDCCATISESDKKYILKWQKKSML